MNLLPTHETLDRIVRRTSSSPSFAFLCEWCLSKGAAAMPVADMIGPADARTLADAFDLAMRQAGSDLRAIREGV